MKIICKQENLKKLDKFTLKNISFSKIKIRYKYKKIYFYLTTWYTTKQNTKYKAWAFGNKD